MNEMIFDLQRFAKIENHNEESLVSGTDERDTIENRADYATIDGGGGDDYINNGDLDRDAGYYVSINGGAGNDKINNWKGEYVTINGGAGDDGINIYEPKCLIYGGAGNDVIWNHNNDLLTINGGDGNDTIENFGNNVTISGGAGDDFIYSYSNNGTITGGKGNDEISLNSSWYDENNLIIYKEGDGNDTIYGFSKSSTLKISGSSYSTITRGNNLIVNVGDDKITLKGAATLSPVNIKFKETSTETNAWKLSETTATFGTTNNTLVTVTGVKSLDGISLSGKVVSVAQASLNQANVTISGSGYTLKLADDVSTTATTSNSWSYKNSVATLKQTKGEKYSLASNGKSISYSAGTSSTLATIKGAKSKNFTVSGKKITLKNSALSKKVSVSGSYEFDFASDYKKAAITGSAKADTLTSRGNNISITGGKGNDVINLAATAKNNLIVYKSGDGKDIINGLTEDDTIKIASAAAQVTTSGADVIFTVGKGSITVKDAAEKTFTYIAGGVKETYSAVAEPYTIDGAAIVLSSAYTKTDLNVTDYGEGLKTINASAVTHALNITGNDNDNKILGGAGNDTLDGYTGDDTLTGGAGSDTFLYYEGDGNDVITDYTASDIIRIEEGDVTPSKKGRDVILKVGEEKITVQNAAKNKIGVTYVENGIEHDYINGEQTALLNEKKTTLTLSKNYWKDNLDFANFGESLQALDATPVTHKLKITGNDKSNQILGSSTKANTITGGGGNDTLQGGYKADVFIYSKGDGNDIIVNYAAGDTISIASGAVDNVKVKGDTVIFTVGKGKISLEGAAGEKITYCDENGRTSKIYSNENANIFEDDNFIAANNLSALVEDKAADYSVAKIETALSSANALQTLTYTRKFFVEEKL